jgi:hypothetical protein
LNTGHTCSALNHQAVVNALFKADEPARMWIAKPLHGVTFGDTGMGIQ